jgi:histidinol-phosphate aminotransferase
VHLYPDPTCEALRRKLSERLGVSPDTLFVGSGATELIELIIKTFTVAGDAVLSSHGSFVFFKLASQALGRRFLEVPMREGYRYDLDAIARSLGDARIMFLANPDNPTGTAFGLDEFLGFLKAVPEHCIVVLDEAYADFAPTGELPSVLDQVGSRPNLVLLRTFSKAHGLAGLRLGYGMGPPQLVDYLHRARAPYSPSVLASIAGMAALDDEEHLRRSRIAAREGVAQLRQQLSAWGLPVPDSKANFVLVPLGRSGAEVTGLLQRAGVLVRDLSAFGHPHAVRITAGTPDHNLRALAGVAAALGRPPP